MDMYVNLTNFKPQLFKYIKKSQNPKYLSEYSQIVYIFLFNYYETKY